MGGGSRGRGDERFGLAVTYFPGDFGGDLKWNEFGKSLKAMGSHITFTGYFFYCYSYRYLYLRPFLFLYLELSFSGWTMHEEDVSWLHFLRGTASLVLPTVNLTIIH